MLPLRWNCAAESPSRRFSLAWWTPSWPGVPRCSSHRKPVRRGGLPMIGRSWLRQRAITPWSSATDANSWQRLAYAQRRPREFMALDESRKGRRCFTAESASFARLVTREASPGCGDSCALAALPGQMLPALLQRAWSAARRRGRMRARATLSSVARCESRLFRISAAASRPARRATPAGCVPRSDACQHRGWRPANDRVVPPRGEGCDERVACARFRAGNWPRSVSRTYSTHERPLARPFSGRHLSDGSSSTETAG